MTEDKKIFLSDSAKAPEEDSFEIHSNIADTIFNIVQKHDIKDSSFTIGLFGKWGSGKTYITNRLEDKINENKCEDITYLYIDVWKYSEYPLLRSILFDLDKQFKTLYNINKDQEENKYQKFKDGYKNDNNKKLNDILYYDEAFESESELDAGEYRSALKKLCSKYKRPLLILFSLLFVFIILQFIPESIQSAKWYKILNPILSGISAFASFIGVAAIFSRLLQKPLKDIGRLIFFKNTVKNFTEKANFSPEQFEAIFRDMLNKVKSSNDNKVNKFVIVFDNVDRCDPDTAYNTLSTIKTFMDIENCIYIIPCDDEAIKKFISEEANFSKNEHLDKETTETSKNNGTNFKRQFAEEFIDKIFQTYIRIPPLKEVDRDQYIKEQLNKIDFKDKIKNEDIDVITQILYYAYKGESPRNIKRFLNDYSSYFRLAMNSREELLDNLILFTLMIAIKQKWSEFEEYLATDHTFFLDYLDDQKGTIERLKAYGIEQKKQYEIEDFLDKVISYIRAIKRESFIEYIHFKESEKSNIIAEKLRNKDTDIEINDETYSVLKNEFTKNSKSQELYALNTFITWAQLINKNKKHPKYTNLVSEFWSNYNHANINKNELIYSLYEENIFKDIIQTLNEENIKQEIELIIPTFTGYLRKPLNEKESDHEHYTEIFKTLINSDISYIINKISESLFQNYKTDNDYLNGLLDIIYTNEKYNYLPNSVLSQLINELDSNSIKILEYWRHKDIPKEHGITLVQKFTQRIKYLQSKINNPNQINENWQAIQENYSLLERINIDFVENENIEPFLNQLNKLPNKIFQHGNNNQNHIKRAIDFWIEIAYFTSLDIETIDNMLSDLYNRFIIVNNDYITYFNENLKYTPQLTKLENVRSTLVANSETNEAFCKKLAEEDKELYKNYKNVFTKGKIQIEFIENYLDYAEKNNIRIDKQKLGEFLLYYILEEFKENKTDISEKLKYLADNFGLKPYASILIDYKNSFIEFYKENPKVAYNSLEIIRESLSKSKFNNNFQLPIIKYINSQLEATNPVVQYLNIIDLFILVDKHELLENTVATIKMCLEKSKKVNENYIGIGLLLKIYEQISEEKLKEIKNLINKNDHIGEWDEQHKTALIEKGILDNDVNTDSSSENNNE